MNDQVVPVTAVIPSYQAGPYLEVSVRSILSQVPAPAEVLVIDDGSTDGSPQRLRELGLPVNVVSQVNAGEGEARNAGLRLAEHDLVALLDADDWWLPGHLAALWGHREGRSFVSSTMIGSQTGRLHGNPTERPRELRNVMDVLWPENAAVASGILLRRDLALDAGGFSRRKRGADLEMWIRLVQRAPAISLPDITSVYREHAAQVSGDGSLMRQALRELMVETRSEGVVADALAAKIETKLAWDDARALQRDGSWAAALRLAPQIIGRPARARAVYEMLRWRAAGRKRQVEAENRLAEVLQQ